MILLIIGAIILLMVLFISIISLIAYLTDQSVEKTIAEIKSIIAYNLIGIEGVVDDIVTKRANKIAPVDKSGKIVVITGGTKGIGKEVIKLLLQCNMIVIMGCRKVTDGEKIRDEIRKTSTQKGELHVFALDTSSLAKVHEFAGNVAKNYTHINYLINNAGIMLAPYAESIDGFESQFATNYLGHFLLTHLLLPLLKNGGSKNEFARIVNVSSCVYTHGKFDFKDINRKKMYISFEAYAQSKLAQIYFTTYLNQLLSNEENACVQVHAVHPGVVNTDLFQYTFVKHYAEWFMKLIFKKPIEGAYPIVHATISPKLEGKGGTYISNCIVRNLADNATSQWVEEKLFAVTKEMLKIQEFGKPARQPEPVN